MEGSIQKKTVASLAEIHRGWRGPSIRLFRKRIEEENAWFANVESGSQHRPEYPTKASRLPELRNRNLPRARKRRKRRALRGRERLAEETGLAQKR